MSTEPIRRCTFVLPVYALAVLRELNLERMMIESSRFRLLFFFRILSLSAAEQIIADQQEKQDHHYRAEVNRHKQHDGHPQPQRKYNKPA